MTAIPVASESGALWVSGIRKISGVYRRFVAALDAKTGVLLWEDDLNAAHDGLDRPAEIQHLKDGGAVVVIPSPYVEGKLPWIIQRRSAADDHEESMECASLFSLAFHGRRRIGVRRSLSLNP